MNILLVYPKYPDTFWSFKHVLKFISKKSCMPPLGLLTIASMLPDEWNKRLVDVNVSALNDDDIEWADMVFISAMIVQKENAQAIINRCKAKARTVVAGGPVFTTQPDAFTGIDHFVLNEAEITLPMFIDDINKGSPRRTYSSNEKPDITKTPVPMWSLINVMDYATMVVQYSRGCPFNCEFCDIIVMNGRVPRTKSSIQLVNELNALYNTGWRDAVFIVDDNFIGNKANVKKMLPDMIKWQKKHDFPFKFTTEASTNLADDSELLNMMSAANFYKVFLGLETPNIDSLNECDKRQNSARDLAKVVRTIHSHGLQVMGGFIVGFDNDNEGIFEKQIKFIQDIGVVTAMVGVLTALPQTRLWHRLKAEGRIISETTANTDGAVNFIPKMGHKALLDGYKNIMATIYSPRNYFKRIETFVESYRPTVKNFISKEDLFAALKSTWKIGIMSRARFFYWRLLLRLSIRKRKAIPVAIELAVYWLHFDKVARALSHN